MLGVFKDMPSFDALDTMGAADTATPASPEPSANEAHDAPVANPLAEEPELTDGTALASGDDPMQTASDVPAPMPEPVRKHKPWWKFW